MATNPCDEVQILYKGDGVDKLFTFPFQYHEQDDVKVVLWDDTTKAYTNTQVRDTDWSFVNANTIKFNTAPPAPIPSATVPNLPEVFNVKIYRLTDVDPLDASFNPGSAIRAEDLNNNFEQLRLAIEDNRCQVPSWFKVYLNGYYWNQFDETVYTNDVWVDTDVHVATTGAIQENFWNNTTNTISSVDLWVASDDTVPTTLAADNRFWDQADETLEFGDAWNPSDNTVATTAKIEEEFWHKQDITIDADQLAGNWHQDDVHLPTSRAVSRRLDKYVQDSVPAPVITEQSGKIWIDNDNLWQDYWEPIADAWVQLANTGPQGPTGITGTFSTINSEVPPDFRTDGTAIQPGDVWYNPLNAYAFVWHVDPDSSQWVSLSRPGPQGAQGQPGAAGAASTVPGPAGPPGPSGAGTNGTPGTNGIDGIDGNDGAAATITVGTVTTGVAGSNVVINNSGTTAAAVFDITIPRGNDGTDGLILNYIGPLNATDPQPVGGSDADFHLFDTAGTLGASWGVNSGTAVSPGDYAVLFGGAYTVITSASATAGVLTVTGNVVDSTTDPANPTVTVPNASTTVAGLIELSDAADITAGTANTAVTAAQLLTATTAIDADLNAVEADVTQAETDIAANATLAGTQGTAITGLQTSQAAQDLLITGLRTDVDQNEADITQLQTAFGNIPVTDGVNAVTPTTPITASITNRNLTIGVDRATSTEFGTVRLWIGDTAPPTPLLGETWRNTLNGKIYFYDGNVWVNN